MPVRGESDADRPLGDHLEAVITGDDVDENWQLKDPEVTLRSNLAQIKQIDAQLAEAITDTQCRSVTR